MARTPRDFSAGKARWFEVLDRFEEAWGRVVGTQEPPDLAAFLPQADDPVRALLLRELIKTDLEIRWKTGRPIFLESYLERFPELGPPAAPPPRLVQEEFRVGEAMTRARQKVRTRLPEDPSWLAYCCFGDPLARVAAAS